MSKRIRKNAWLLWRTCVKSSGWHKAADAVAAELADVHKMGVQLAIVVGGGNFFRHSCADQLNQGWGWRRFGGNRLRDGRPGSGADTGKRKNY